MGADRVEVSASREDLPGLYLKVLQQNPLLARLEGTLRGLGWSETEIRTYQLLTACASNASLKAALEQKEILGSGGADHRNGGRPV